MNADQREAAAMAAMNVIVEKNEKVEEWMKESGARRCNRCKFIVEKSQGCDHMTCRCGYEFCYICGGKY